MKLFKEDLTGKKFNKLTVLSFHGRLSKKSVPTQTLPYWNCVCDCGNQIIANSSCLKTSNTKSCGCLGKENAVKVGERYDTSFGVVEVIEKYTLNRYKVRFEDGYEKITTAKSIQEGKVKNPYKPHVKGVGFIGEGKYKCRNGDNYCPEYEIWNGILKRCYSEKFHEGHPTYKGCSVASEWHNFQVFAEWLNNQPNYGKNYELDKDFLKLGNKIYSPEFCRLIPQEVNAVFTGSENTLKGVHWCKTKNKYIVQCHIGEKTATGNPKQSYFGAFDDLATAREVYKKHKTEKVLEVLSKYDDIDPIIVDNIKLLLSNL